MALLGLWPSCYFHVQCSSILCFWTRHVVIYKIMILWFRLIRMIKRVFFFWKTNWIHETLFLFSKKMLKTKKFWLNRPAKFSRYQLINWTMNHFSYCYSSFHSRILLAEPVAAQSSAGQTNDQTGWTHLSKGRNVENTSRWGANVKIVFQGGGVFFCWKTPFFLKKPDFWPKPKNAEKWPKYGISSLFLPETWSGWDIFRQKIASAAVILRPWPQPGRHKLPPSVVIQLSLKTHSELFTCPKL